MANQLLIGHKQDSLQWGVWVVLNIGPIKMYISNAGDTQCRTNEGCTYVH